MKQWLQGGQLALHRIRMTKQIIKSTWNVAFLLGLMAASFVMYSKTPRWAASQAWQYYCVQAIAQINPNLKFNYKNRQGQNQKVVVKNLRHHKDLKLGQKFVMINGKFSLLIGFFVSFLTFVIVGLVWSYIGRQTGQTQQIRGGTFVDAGLFRRTLKRRFGLSWLKVCGLPLMKGSEKQHILFSGTTGCGKSTAIKDMVRQIRQKKQKAIIVDLNGEYVSRFYNPETDLLLNPLDERSINWHPYHDLADETEIDEMLQALIPNSNHDNFWNHGARTVVKEAMKKLGPHLTYDDLIYECIESPLKEASDFFSDTKAASLISKDNEKMSMSIRSIMSPYLQVFQTMSTTNPTSLTKWVNNSNNGCLFLTCMPHQRQFLQGLLSMMFDLLTKKVMSLGENPKRTIWFITDELAALQKLPSLKTLLAEGRKFGACSITGIQTLSQLHTIYGTKEAQTLLSLYNTQFVFRCNDAETARSYANFLGEQDKMEWNEGLSFGANEVRDGVSLNQQHKTESLVTATDILNLPDLTCYVKYKAMPITKWWFKFKDVKPTQEPFWPTQLIREQQTTHLESSEENDHHEQTEPELEEKAETTPENEKPKESEPSLEVQ